MSDKQEESKLAQSYENMAAKAREIFAASSEKTLASLEKAIEAARVHFVKVGEVTQQESAHLKTYLRRDLEQAAKQFQNLSDQAKKKLTSENIQVGFMDLTAQLAHGASDLFSRLAEWAETGSSYHTGQVTSPGTLKCKKCEKTMNFKKTGNIPPCPGCRSTDFVKVDSPSGKNDH